MRPVASIIIKDIVIELRNKETISSMLMFGLLTVVIFSFAFEPSGADRNLIAPGVLWVSFLFASILGLNRSLSTEIDNDCMQGLLLAPISRGDLYLAKVTANFVFTMIAELIVMLAFSLFYNLRVGVELAEIAGVAALGSFGFVAIGTILSLISASTRMKEVMLPILLIPITVPVILSAVEATGMILRGETKGISFPLSLMGGFGVIYLTASYLLFEYVVED